MPTGQFYCCAKEQVQALYSFIIGDNNNIYIFGNLNEFKEKVNLTNVINVKLMKENILPHHTK